MSIRTFDACAKRSTYEILNVEKIKVPVMDVIDDAVINGTDREYRDAMVAKYGTNWENMQ